MDRPYLRPEVAREEQRHRVAIALALVLLSLLAFGPVLSHLVPAHARALLAGYDRVGHVCLYALHLLLAPVHGGFHLLLAAGVIGATCDRVRALLRQRSVMRVLSVVRPAPGDPVARAARAAGVDADRVFVVEGLPTPALTVGLWAPRILVARALAHQLGPEELLAVIAHEGAHMRRRDPLRAFLLRFVSRMLFWLPALDRLGAAFLDETEILADDHAARCSEAGDRSLALASALVTLAGCYRPHVLAEAGASFQPATSNGLLARRVRRLAGEATPVSMPLTPSYLAAALVALAIVWLSILPVLHPASGAVPSGASCDHPSRPVLSHLTCDCRHGRNP